MNMYAWSKFKGEVNEWGQVTKWIMPGEKISQSDLGVSDEEWDSLVESGAVREDEYPDIANDVSPAEHFATNPDEAPEPTLDETTSSDEQIGHSEDAGAQGGTPDTKPWER